MLLRLLPIQMRVLLYTLQLYALFLPRLHHTMASTNLSVGSESTVTFFSWNVGGINGLGKRSRVFSHVEKLKGDVIFLQETHLLKADQLRLSRPWFGQMFHSKFEIKTRGTAILIGKKVQFIPTMST